MKGTRNYLVSYLLAAALAAGAVVTAACGSGNAVPSVGAPPASPHTAAEKAATLNWLAKTNQMWTRNDFATLDQVTTGEMRAIYQSEERQKALSPMATQTSSPSGKACRPSPWFSSK